MFPALFTTIVPLLLVVVLAMLYGLAIENRMKSENDMTEDLRRGFEKISMTEDPRRGFEKISLDGILPTPG